MIIIEHLRKLERVMIVALLADEGNTLKNVAFTKRNMFQHFCTLLPFELSWQFYTIFLVFPTRSYFSKFSWSSVKQCILILLGIFCFEPHFSTLFLVKILKTVLAYLKWILCFESEFLIFFLVWNYFKRFWHIWMPSSEIVLAYLISVSRKD